MSSIPNKFNLHGDEANQSGYVPIQMIQNSKMVQSTFITSDHTNHGDLFSSSPSFTDFQNSHASSSSSGFNNLAYQKMTRNIESVSAADYFPINNNPHLTRVSFTQTITNRCTALVPTNTLGTIQYDIERVKRAMDSESNFSNPTSHRPNVFDEQCEILNPEPLNVIYPHQDFAYRPNVFDKQCEILNPEPLNVIYPHQDVAYRQHLGMFSLSSKHNHGQHVPQCGRYVKKNPDPANIFEKTTDYIDLGEDDEYDGQTHSLPYEKYGPYTCPKCNGVFDTSQKFAAHMSSHYKNETSKEKNQRFHARNKRKYHKLRNVVHGESQKSRLVNGINSSGVSNDENVKEEPI